MTVKTLIGLQYLAMPWVNVDCLPFVVSGVTSQDLTPGEDRADYLGDFRGKDDFAGGESSWLVRMI